MKLGNGTFCGELVHGPGRTIYTLNGFFPQLRQRLLDPAQIHYYVVEWDSGDLSWSAFRGNVIGLHNPTEAARTSFRGVLCRDWQELGLAAQPDADDNGVHESASPLEALLEKRNWLG